MGHPRPPQDRPDRVPMADPAVHRPRRRDPLRPHRRGPRRSKPSRARTASTRPAREYDHRGNKCTFEVLIDDYHLDADPALVRLARIVHAADIETEIDTDPFAPALLALAFGGLDVEADDHRLLERASFVYDALYAWCARQVEAGAA